MVFVGCSLTKSAVFVSVKLKHFSVLWCIFYVFLLQEFKTMLFKLKNFKRQINCVKNLCQTLGVSLATKS